MSEVRRYTNDEVAGIFEAAATDSPARLGGPSAAEGLTLAELQSIGREVGLPPERVAEAAAMLDVRRAGVPARTHLGMPTSAGRSVELPRALTDREWEILLSEIRETFGARGRDASAGGIRQWTNGNLQAYVEPTDAGYRLRLGSVKGDAAPTNRLGIGGVLTGLGLAVIGALSGEAGALAAPAVVTALGAGTLFYNTRRLPRWMMERERQMERIALRARALAGAGPARALAPADE